MGVAEAAMRLRRARTFTERGEIVDQRLAILVKICVPTGT
jgi:hypothetical protein